MRCVYSNTYIETHLDMANDVKEGNYILIVILCLKLQTHVYCTSYTVTEHWLMMLTYAYNVHNCYYG